MKNAVMAVALLLSVATITADAQSGGSGKKSGQASSGTSGRQNGPSSGLQQSNKGGATAGRTTNGLGTIGGQRGSTTGQSSTSGKSSKPKKQ